MAIISMQIAPIKSQLGDSRLIKSEENVKIFEVGMTDNIWCQINVLMVWHAGYQWGQIGNDSHLHKHKTSIINSCSVVTFGQWTHTFSSSLFLLWSSSWQQSWNTWYISSSLFCLQLSMSFDFHSKADHFHWTISKSV